MMARIQNLLADFDAEEAEIATAQTVAAQKFVKSIEYGTHIISSRVYELTGR